ncbi:hypothetical protein CK203_093945 [Vitis vinifera]|uniref:Uncharacterized protein n=1 Tax=Vitis vinifera TaxID=29760 RepID=A0A438CKA3_VITVI|nr:hypothetical protein CK203_093945 [Vitis vinifera]
MKGEESSSKAEQGSKTKEAEHLISRCQNFAHLISRSPKDTPRTRVKSLESRTVIYLHFGHGKTRGGHSASPSSPTPRPHRAAMGAAASPPVQAPAIPPSEGEAPSQPKRTKFSGPGEPSHAPQPEPPTEDSGFLWISSRDRYQASHDSGPPIEGNLDCRDRSFHSETYFDIEALRQQPELRDSFRLLQRYHMETDARVPLELVTLLRPSVYLMSLFQADFREWSSFSQSDMVRILSRGTSTASVLTRRELPSGMLLIDVLLRANLFPLQHKVQRRGAILEAFRISEGYFFGPHHLIMTSLLHFEEKVHQKKLQRADGIPLLFPRLLCQILEHWAILKSPVLRGAAIARGFLSRQMASLGSLLCTQGAPAVPAPPELPRDEQLPQAQQDEILTETTPPAPAAHLSAHARGYTFYLPITQGLVRSLQTLSTAQDSIIHQMATIRAHQDQIIATQAQHTTILHQIQQHLSMQTPLGHDRSAPSEPLVPDEESLPAEQPIPEEEIRAEPSHDPTHI